jgi:RNA polymerase sigma-70 factor (ECF subfamily)
VSVLIRTTRDWQLAEDATQDAFASAIERWPVHGIPDRPGAWLTTVARHRAVDRLRSTSTDESRQSAFIDRSEMTEINEISDVDDDRLRLIFTCCHPALPLAGRVALTLRTVAGLELDEVARAFLVSEDTMAQRLVRARRKIANAAIPYRVPPPELLEERLDAVLAVLYLVFNAGYSDTDRAVVAEAAIDLAQALSDLMPRESEAHGLLALMLFHHSRRRARLTPDGQRLTLDEQDRRLWSVDDIRRGQQALRTASERGPYVVQAAIAELHATAVTPAATDWVAVVALYDDLMALTPTPVVALNRAVAIGLGGAPDLALVMLDEVAPQLEGFAAVPAARAELLARAGRVGEARCEFDRAIDLTATELERQQLARRRSMLPAVS